MGITVAMAVKFKGKVHLQEILLKFLLKLVRIFLIAFISSFILYPSFSSLVLIVIVLKVPQP